uniref:Uncharacterized protein n=1 Tax=Thermococcus sp. IRI33 TaxID=1197733 RepID=L0B9K8_9EURY|nr:hypothetical protein i33-3 [Thermococcus sp. IRI33]
MSRIIATEGIPCKVVVLCAPQTLPPLAEYSPLQKTVLGI